MTVRTKPSKEQSDELIVLIVSRREGFPPISPPPNSNSSSLRSYAPRYARPQGTTTSSTSTTGIGAGSSPSRSTSSTTASSPSVASLTSALVLIPITSFWPTQGLRPQSPSRRRATDPVWSTSSRAISTPSPGPMSSSRPWAPPSRSTRTESCPRRSWEDQSRMLCFAPRTGKNTLIR